MTDEHATWWALDGGDNEPQQPPDPWSEPYSDGSEEQRDE